MIIRGTMVAVKPVEVLNSKVYIRKNIIKIDESGEEGFHGWEYDETELPLEKYISSIEFLGQQVTNLMLGV